MKHLVGLAAAVGLAACATAVDEPQPVEVAPAATLNTPAQSVFTGVDATEGTYWTALDKPWPEAPELLLINPAVSPSDPYAVSFSCNSDTGAISGAVLGQDPTRIGEEAVFDLVVTPTVSDVQAVDLRADNAMTFPLNGVVEANGDGAAFDFPIDWLALNAMGEAQRAAFVAPDGTTPVALYSAASDGVDTAESAEIAARLSQFSEAANQFYYFCNPK